MVEQLIAEINSNATGGSYKKSIISYILLKGSSLIPDIARDLQCSVPTATKYIAQLCNEGTLVDLGKQSIQKGRRPSLYGINKDYAYFVGVDINRFDLKIGLINFAGEIIREIDDTSYRFEDTRENMELLCTLVRKFIDGSGETGKKIMAININISGRVDALTGRSYDVYNFDRHHSSLAATLTDLIGYKTYIENDTRAMTYGELMTGHARELNNYLFVNFSWGISLGIIIDGKIYYGKDGYSGEFGHMNIYDNEIICHCGKRGCLETEISGSALNRKLTESIRAGKVSLLSGRLRANGHLTTRDILDALAHEDSLVIELLEAMCSELGRQLAGMVNLLNPEAVIIGGIFSDAGDYMLDPIKTAIRKYSLKLIFENVSIEISRMGNRAGIIGASLLARYNTLNRSEPFDEQDDIRPEP